MTPACLPRPESCIFPSACSMSGRAAWRPRHKDWSSCNTLSSSLQCTVSSPMAMCYTAWTERSTQSPTFRCKVNAQSPGGLTTACAEAGIESSGLRSSCCMEPTASRYMPCMLPQTPLPSSPSSCRLVVTRSSCRQPNHCCVATMHAVDRYLVATLQAAKYHDIGVICTRVVTQPSYRQRHPFPEAQMCPCQRSVHCQPGRWVSLQSLKAATCRPLEAAVEVLSALRQQMRSGPAGGRADPLACHCIPVLHGTALLTTDAATCLT